jgi:hypothetical protein
MVLEAALPPAEVASAWRAWNRAGTLSAVVQAMKHYPEDALAEKLNSISFCGVTDWTPRHYCCEIRAAPILISQSLGRWINLRVAETVADNLSAPFSTTDKNQIVLADGAVQV